MINSDNLRHVLLMTVFVSICLVKYQWVDPVLGSWLKRLGGALKPTGDAYVIDGNMPYTLVFFLYTVMFGRSLLLLSLPVVIINILGILIFNTFPPKPRLRSSPLFSPFVCFRVVTRGLFPELVRENVLKNLDTCYRVGIEYFVIQVVTDTSINLPRWKKTYETVVPTSYATSKGSLFKARALQYTLEDGVNILNDDDWIVHLDEETMMTESSIIGILNFINDGSSSFGQGVITYANGPVVNWVTTLIDSTRVAFDYGAIRFCLKVFRKPLMNWKGSFIVANVGAERDVSFDHGQEGSIAEDCFFAAVAMGKGYVFNWVEGEMHEQSTFTVNDFVRQRKRWFQGIYLTVFSRQIKHTYRFSLLCILGCVSAMPFITISLYLCMYFSLEISPIMQRVLLPVEVYPFLFVFGAIRSLNRNRIGTVKYILLVLATIPLIPVDLILEIVAVLWGMLAPKVKFDIVNKVSTKKHSCYSYEPVDIATFL